MKRLHCVIIGRVQGVNFRWFVKEKAGDFAVVGMVKNTDDGSVEIIAEGGEADLRRFLSEVSKGPRYAVVGTVETAWLQATGEFVGFTIG